MCICGISIGEIELKIIQFADDTNLFSLFTQDHDAVTMRDINYQATEFKIKNIIQAWKHRDLSIIGKIIMIIGKIIIIMIGSLFVYKINALPSLTKEMLDNFNSLLRSFLWGKGNPKISQNPPMQGGKWTPVVQFVVQGTSTKNTMGESLF